MPLPAIVHRSLLSLLLLTTLPHSALADSQQYALDIPPRPLISSLTAIASSTGIQIVSSPDTPAIQAPAIQGNFTLEQALNQLLSGSGLQWQWVNERTIRIAPPAAAANENTIQLGPVRVQGALDPKDEAYRAPASVNVLTREHIERFRGTSVGDIFQGTAGVLVGENRNSGGLDVNIRGMQGQGRVPVLIDGSRQETTVYRGYAGVSSRSYVDPDLIGNIRIDKGPVMTAEGTGATGGVVSMRTLEAQDIIEGNKPWGIRLRGSLVSNNSSTPPTGTYAGYYLEKNAYRSDCRIASYCTPEYTMPEKFGPDEGMRRPDFLDLRGHAGSLAFARRFEWGEVVAAYAERTQGNYYAGKHGPAPYIRKGEPRDMVWYWETPVSIDGVSRFRAGERIPNSQFSNQSWLVKSSVMLPSDQALELGFIRYTSEFGEMMPSQIRGFGQANQWLDSEVQNDTYTLRYRWEPVAHDWADLKFNLWHTDAVSHINTPEIYSIDIADNTHRVDDYQRYGADISNTSRFFHWGEFNFNYGLAAQTEQMDTDANRTGDYGGARGGQRDELSVFFSSQWKPVSWLTLDAGTRYTRFESTDNNPLSLGEWSQFCEQDENGDCLPRYFGTSHSGSAPVFAITWEPITGIQLYGRYAEALRMPSLFETTSGWSVSPSLDIYLKPEKAKNREIGLNILRRSLFTENDRFAFSVAYFRNHTKDYLTRTSPNYWEDGRSNFFAMRNIQGATFHGAELSLEYDNGWLFTEISGTRYNHIEVCNIGSGVRYYCTNWGIANSYVNNMIPPNWHASALLGIRLLQQKLELGVRGTFMGQRNKLPRYNANPGFNGVIQWHKYNLLDVFASYQLNNSLSVDFNIDNATDRYYLDALSLGMVPAPGRTARLGFTLQF